MHRTLAHLCLLALLALALPARAQALDSALGELVQMIPAGRFTEPALEVTLFRPPGDGPFPLVLINHGRAPGLAKLQPRFRPLLAAREFVRRGYAVVVPMRQGFSQSGGHEISGGCNVYSNGLQQARSVRRTLDWLATQPWADVSRNVVLGQSHGGLTTLAYGTDPQPGTRLLVNFAGGLRQENCTSWQAGLVDAIGQYGQAARLPSLWFYGDNDSYFPPAVWRDAHQRFVQAGGQAELVAFGNFGSDAHLLFGSRAGLPIWLPRVLAAMEAAGLPVQVQVPVPVPVPVQGQGQGQGQGQLSLAGADASARTSPSGFAALADISRLPVKTDRARDGYRSWLAADTPRAFAVHSATGAWGSAWGGEQPLARALANCARNAGSPCRLYAVDDSVVWAAE